MRLLVHKKYTLKEPDSRLRPIELLGCKNTKNKINKTRFVQWTRETNCHILIVHQPDSEPSESGENHSKKPTQTLVTTEPTLESRIRKERESQELDENSKSTLECFSSWCQVLKEWRRCSSYGNPRERQHYKGSVTQTQTAGYSAHSKNYTCPTNTKSSPVL